MQEAQANPSKNLQREIPLLGEYNTEVVDLPTNIVAMCDTEQAAFRLCVSKSKSPLSQEEIAEELGMTKGGFNTILNSDHNKRPRYLPRVKQIHLQQLCQNRAIDQWADLYEKGMLNCQRTLDDELQELERRRAELLAAKQRMGATR